MASRKHLTLALTAGALVAALAGFGGTPVRDKPPDACKLVTTREAAKILGKAVNKGKETKTTPRPGAKARKCEWASKKKGVGGIEGSPFKLQVEVNTGSTVRGDYEKAKSRVDLKDLVTVPDLGKDAFYDARPFSGVHILIGDDRVLSVRVQNYNTAKADLRKPPAEMSVEAATIAVKRLGTA